MDIKVGQVWKHSHTQRDWRVVFVGKYDITVADEEGTISESFWKFREGIYKLILDSEPALCANQAICENADESWEEYRSSHFESYENLWADFYKDGFKAGVLSVSSND